MGKRKRSVSSEEEFQVEVILAARVNESCEWEYLIRWAGYDSSEDGWEPQENIQKNCQRLISSFWDDVGMDNEDYLPGYRCDANPAWKKKEIKRFRNDPENQRYLKKNELEAEAKKSKRGKSASEEASRRTKKKKAEVEVEEDSSSEDAIESTRRRLGVNDSKRSKAKEPERLFLNDGDDEGVEGQEESISSKRKAKGKQKAQDRDSPPPVSAGSKKGTAKGKKSEAASLFSDEEDVPLSKSITPPSKPPSPPKASKPKNLTVRIPPNTTFEASKPGFTKSAKPTSATSAKPATSASSSSTPKLPGPIKNLPSFLMKPSTSKEPVSAGISVKSRLAQAAITPRDPKTEVQQAKKHSLSSISFKKKPAPEHNSPVQDTSSPQVQSPQQESFISPVISSRETSFAAQSPISPTEYMPTTERTYSPEAALPVDEPYNDDEPSMQDIAMERVDSFLQSMMPSGPLDDEVPIQDNSDEIILPARTSLSGASLSETPMASDEPSKKWLWSGTLSIQREKEKAPAKLKEKSEDGFTRPDEEEEEKVVLKECEFLCDAVVTDHAQIVVGGMPLRVALSGVQSIVLESFMPIHHLEEIMMASNPPEAAARLLSSKEGGSAMKRFADYLQTNKQVAIARVTIDNVYSANLLCYPVHLTSELPFQTPGQLSAGFGLVVMLVPWAIPREQLAKDWRVPEAHRQSIEYPIHDNVQNKDFLNTFRQAIGILGYPEWMDEFMSHADRQYCIWTGTGEETNATVELEVAMLSSILGRYPEPVKVSHEEPSEVVKAVFVHAQSLESLPRISRFKERRMKYEPMFVVFGTLPPTASLVEHQHPTGLWEIYPIGGVVTFTAKALYRHPDAIFDRVKQIEEHPLWTCYIIPPVLGMAAKLFHKDEDPLEAFDRGEFAYQFLLDAIDNGEVGLLRCPPPVSNITTTHWKPSDDHHQETASSILTRHTGTSQDWRDSRSDWLEDQVDGVFRDPRATLQYCLAEFQKLYGNKDPSMWEEELQDEIANDMRGMQMQPSIMTDYRRFVVLRSEEEQERIDEFEWVSPDTFQYHDITDDGTPPPDSPPPS